MNNKHYSLLLQQAEGLLAGETDPLANAANLCSLLYFNIERINWVGFYFLQNDELVLGPFHGQPACTRIAIGAGVCGTAFAENETQLVNDVHNFDGHIACDIASASELVVPFVSNSAQNLVVEGVLDVDSPEVARFDSQEQLFFEEIVSIYLSSISSGSTIVHSS